MTVHVKIIYRDDKVEEFDAERFCDFGDRFIWVNMPGNVVTVSSDGVSRVEQKVTKY